MTPDIDPYLAESGDRPWSTSVISFILYPDYLAEFRSNYRIPESVKLRIPKPNEVITCPEPRDVRIHAAAILGRL